MLICNFVLGNNYISAGMHWGMTGMVLTVGKSTNAANNWQLNREKFIELFIRKDYSNKFHFYIIN